ncbi:uncharacterized protein LOC111274113 [Durio zibethinus]|uniref:Uncharacterized protein LOC111274113 n=1 Tax=Durio zibethinus TaxID=66656 RepID=A0A6P5WEP8_DURZI|nr:uncharacterized protein LOC111274113 [Durio zibethinus]
MSETTPNFNLKLTLELKGARVFGERHLLLVPVKMEGQREANRRLHFDHLSPLPSPPLLLLEKISANQKIWIFVEIEIKFPPQICNGSTDVDSISTLIALQTRSNFYHVRDGLISLLRNCLELETQHNSSVTILSGYVDHFQSLPSVDVGWGCGWRNIQMLSSHLLACRQEARQVLFGGSGFVPDIAFLQRWLEIAWERGFDPPGAQHFNCKIYGSIHRIGTTECASLLRSFGLRARVVDFGPEESQPFYLSVPSSTAGQPVMKRNAIQVSGPMDRYVHQQQGLKKRSHSCVSLGNGRSDNSKGKSEGPQVLVDWVWNYFSDTGLTISGSSRVVVTDRA